MWGIKSHNCQQWNVVLHIKHKWHDYIFMKVAWCNTQHSHISPNTRFTANTQAFCLTQAAVVVLSGIFKSWVWSTILSRSSSSSIAASCSGVSFPECSSGLVWDWEPLGMAGMWRGTWTEGATENTGSEATTGSVSICIRYTTQMHTMRARTHISQKTVTIVGYVHCDFWQAKSTNNELSFGILDEGFKKHNQGLLTWHCLTYCKKYDWLCDVGSTIIYCSIKTAHSPQSCWRGSQWVHEFDSHAAKILLIYCSSWTSIRTTNERKLCLY